MSKHIPNSNLDPSLKEQTLPFSAIQAQTSFLQGKVLTIVDASYASETQNKAIKDLIKQTFADHIKWMRSLAFGNDNGGDLLYCQGTQI